MVLQCLIDSLPAARGRFTADAGIHNIETGVILLELQLK